MTKTVAYRPTVPRVEQRVLIRGVDYCIYEWGSTDSPLMIYLHGWGDTGSTFQFVVDALSSEWRVLAPDWRGFGRSPFRCSGYWFPDYLADLHTLLSTVSPSDPALLVGHSMGANVAALYAGTFPERVKAFVNIEGFGLPDSDPADAPAHYRKWIEAAGNTQSYSSYDNVEALAARINRRHASMSAARARFVAEEWAIKDVDGRVQLRADPLHKLPNPVLYRRAEAEACWRGATAAMLTVIGSQSPMARQLPQRSRIPGFKEAESIVLDGTGHMPHFEVPEALAAAIEDFLLPAL